MRFPPVEHPKSFSGLWPTVSIKKRPHTHTHKTNRRSIAFRYADSIVEVNEILFSKKGRCFPIRQQKIYTYITRREMDIVFNYLPNGQSDKKEKEKYHLFTMCRYRVAVTYRAIVSFPPPTV